MMDSSPAREFTERPGPEIPATGADAAATEPLRQGVEPERTAQVFAPASDEVHAGELQDLRARLAEAESALSAIRNGQVDAVMVAGESGEQVYSLRGTDRVYRQLIETMSEGAVILSEAGVILYCNARLATLLGRPLDRVLGSALLDHVPLSDQPALEALLAQARTEPGRREINVKTSENRLVPIYLSASRLHNDGEPDTFSLVLTELTEQKHHEQLVAAERLARLILEQAVEAIIVCDEHGLVIRASEAARKLCEGAPLLRPFATVFALRTRTAEVFRLSPVLQGETLQDLDVVLALPGRNLELILNAGPLWHGQRILGCVVNLTDVTRRKQAEAEHQRLTRAIEQVAETVVVTDILGNITYVNPAFETITGYLRAEVLGRNPRFLKSGEQDMAFYRALWAIISGGGTWQGRLVNKKKNGTLYTESATISPVRDASGVITSYVAVKRDVTRELALEAQFLQSQKMEGIGQLAGGIAHDFNNLLCVILSCTGFALEGLPEGAPLRDDLLEAQQAGERAAALTRQLLAFSRQQLLQPVSLDLNLVLGELEKMLRRIIGEDIDLLLAQAPELALVMADPGQIEQVLMNLAVNARDAMPRGGRLLIETANVDLDAQYAAEHPGVIPGLHVMLAVTDSGIGMDAQTMARIFEPFFTTKGVGKGTGLGLSTIDGIVKQSGGTISVHSELGGGTSFRVYLPQAPSAVSAIASRPVVMHPRVEGAETVLVVEDVEALRKITRRILEGAGYTVLTAADAHDALLISAQHEGDIHLLLTDVVMPGIGGAALAQELVHSRPTLKLLYMSGYTDDAIVRHGVGTAEAKFLGKPFSRAELTGKVRQVLDDDPAAEAAAQPAEQPRA